MLSYSNFIYFIYYISNYIFSKNISLNLNKNVSLSYIYKIKKIDIIFYILYKLV